MSLHTESQNYVVNIALVFVKLQTKAENATHFRSHGKKLYIDKFGLLDTNLRCTVLYLQKSGTMDFLLGKLIVQTEFITKNKAYYCWL